MGAPLARISRNSATLQKFTGQSLQKPTTKVKLGLPEYLDKADVDALVRAAPPARGRTAARARLLILLQWRAGLRVSEALALTGADLSLESDRPTLKVRSGKGGKPRIVPVHPELKAALQSFIDFRDAAPETKLIGVSRQTALAWVREAAQRAISLGAPLAGRKIGTHTLRHSFARHLLLEGIPINALSRWLGHAHLSTTLRYLELVPDPAGNMERIP